MLFLKPISNSLTIRQLMMDNSRVVVVVVCRLSTELLHGAKTQKQQQQQWTFRFLWPKWQKLAATIDNCLITAKKYQQMAIKKSNIEILFFKIMLIDKESGNSNKTFYNNDFFKEFNGHGKSGGSVVYQIWYFWP